MVLSFEFKDLGRTKEMDKVGKWDGLEEVPCEDVQMRGQILHGKDLKGIFMAWVIVAKSNLTPKHRQGDVREHITGGSAHVTLSRNWWGGSLNVHSLPCPHFQAAGMVSNHPAGLLLTLGGGVPG